MNGLTHLLFLQVYTVIIYFQTGNITPQASSGNKQFFFGGDGEIGQQNCTREQYLGEERSLPLAYRKIPQNYSFLYLFKSKLQGYSSLKRNHAEISASLDSLLVQKVIDSGYQVSLDIVQFSTSCTIKPNEAAPSDSRVVVRCIQGLSWCAIPS